MKRPLAPRAPAATYLFVPADRPERRDKALAAGADVVIIDLEDAVAPEHKAAARTELAGWLRDRPALAGRIVVRINDDSTPWFEADLAFIAAAAIGGVMLPKAETPDQLARAGAALPDAGFLLPIIESARGVLNVDAIAAAGGVQRLAFGTLDYAADLGLSGDQRGLLYPACRIALAARAAGLAPPIAGVTAEFGNDAALLADLAFASACGFGAKLCIHPRQVALVRAAFAPSAEQLAWARRVVEAAASGPGALRIDGAMVDRPVVLKAQAILARAAQQD